MNTATKKIANTLIVKLPFPDACLFPNRKNGTHFRVTLSAKEKQISDAYWLTKQASAGYAVPDGYIPLSLLFSTPDKHIRDLDNMLAASKALIDGMARALGVDDSRFKPVLVDWSHGSKGGALVAAVGVQIVSWVSP